MTEPTLRIIIGTAGSGKSTIARRLARPYAAAYLDKDAMSARFVEAALLAAGYDPGDRESNANASCPWSTTRSWSRRDEPQHWPPSGHRRTVQPLAVRSPLHHTAAERFGWPPVDVEVVRVRVSPETLRHRLRERGLERDRVKLAHWDEYWATHGGQPCAWAGVRYSELSNDPNDAAEVPNNAAGMKEKN